MIPVVRLGRSPLARRKGEGERRALRRAAFHSYFAPAPAWVLNPAGLRQEQEVLSAEWRLLALTDAVGRDLMLGVALGSRPDARSLVLRAPRPALAAAGLRWRALRLASDLAKAA